MAQINLYQQTFTDRYSFSEYGISGTAKNQSMDYINFMKGYLDANDLIRTPNSAGEEGNRFSYNILESVRYAFCLLNTQDPANIEIANKIITRLFVIGKDHTLAKPHLVSWMSTFDCWGGFGWWWRANVWGDTWYTASDSYFTYYIIPYIAMIYSQFLGNLSVDNQKVMSEAIRPLETWLQNRYVVKENPLFYLLTIQNLLIINSIIQRPALERQAMDMFCGFAEGLFTLGRSNTISSADLQGIILSLRLILDYAPTEFKEIVSSN